MSETHGIVCYALAVPPPAPAEDPAEPPARVKVAVEVLHQLTAKTRTRGFTSDSRGLEELAGARLTDDERALQKACCQYLVSYLGGVQEV